MTAPTLPNDELAERALIGHTLALGRIPESVNGLAAGDFYRPVNETIWAAVRSLSDQGKPCDLPSVLAQLEERGQLERGKAQHSSRKATDLGLVELLQAPPIVDPAHIVENIQQHAKRRRVIELHQRGLQQAHDPASHLESLLRHTEEELGRISGRGSEPSERRTWRSVDLGPVLYGDWKPAEPTVGVRDDGKGLFYKGKGHTVISETEGGKTWLALCTALDEMHAGNHVLYIDFEDDEGTVVGRLLTLGASRDLIAKEFHYIRPEMPLDRSGTDDLRDIAGTYRPSLGILDGITEAMTMHGLNPLDNKDAARFGRMLPRRLASTDTAVVSLDHVTKDREGRGRYAIGAIHKLNALDGAGYLLENRHPFGVGLTGRSTIKITKDRPGQLRCSALPSSGGLHWYGDLVLKSHGQGFAEMSIEPPHERDQTFRPTNIMKAISDLLGQKGPLSQRVLRDLIGGKAETVSKALSRLIADGYVDNKTPHKLLKAYDPETEST